MRTYIYEFQGVYLSGYMYVRAENREAADELFKCNVPRYLYPIKIEDTTVTEIKAGKTAVVIADGDY
jgi:hypothetical protein